MLTVKEAAAGVRLTQWAIYRAIQRGDLTAYKPGGRLRIYETDLEAWLQSTRVRAQDQPRARTVRMLPPLTPDRGARRLPESGSLRARVRARQGKQAAA
jgi:excisionase family DNA binding protein